MRERVQYLNMALPTMVEAEIGPKYRPSAESDRTSPIMKYTPAGTAYGLERSKGERRLGTG